MTTATASAAPAAAPSAAPALASTTQLSIAYGGWAQDALVMAEPAFAMVASTLYAKFAPALVQVFYPPSSLSALIDTKFKALEGSVSGASPLSFDTHSTIVANVLKGVIAEVPGFEKALSGTLPSTIINGLKTLGVLPAAA